MIGGQEAGQVDGDGRGHRETPSSQSVSPVSLMELLLICSHYYTFTIHNLHAKCFRKTVWLQRCLLLGNGAKINTSH